MRRSCLGAPRGQSAHPRPRRSDRHWRSSGGRPNTRFSLNGGGGIRTRGPLARTLVFKTSAFDRSATPPGSRASMLAAEAANVGPSGLHCRERLSRRGGRVAEGTRLLSEYGVHTPSRVRIPPSPLRTPPVSSRPPQHEAIHLERHRGHGGHRRLAAGPRVRGRLRARPAPAHRRGQRCDRRRGRGRRAEILVNDSHSTMQNLRPEGAARQRLVPVGQAQAAVHDGGPRRHLRRGVHGRLPRRRSAPSARSCPTPTTRSRYGMRA